MFDRRKSKTKKSTKLLDRRISKTTPDTLVKNYKSEQIQQLKEIFLMYDKSNRGAINPTTLKFLLRGFGDNVNQAELMARLKQMDDDGNGQIDFQEFICYMMDKVNKRTLVNDLIDLFHVFDKEGTGYMTPIGMKVILNEQVDPQSLNYFLETADMQNQGSFQYEKFLKNVFLD